MRAAARALGLPGTRRTVRAVGLVELPIAVAGVVIGGGAAVVVAAAYGVLAVATLLLWRRARGHAVRLPWCVHRAASGTHVVVNAAAAVAATLAVFGPRPFTVIADQPLAGVPFLLLVAPRPVSPRSSPTHFRRSAPPSEKGIPDGRARRRRNRRARAARRARRGIVAQSRGDPAAAAHARRRLRHRRERCCSGCAAAGGDVPRTAGLGPAARHRRRRAPRRRGARPDRRRRSSDAARVPLERLPDVPHVLGGVRGCGRAPPPRRRSHRRRHQGCGRGEHQHAARPRTAGPAGRAVERRVGDLLGTRLAVLRAGRRAERQRARRRHRRDLAAGVEPHHASDERCRDRLGDDLATDLRIDQELLAQRDRTR